MLHPYANPLLYLVAGIIVLAVLLPIAWTLLTRAKKDGAAVFSVIAVIGLLLIATSIIGGIAGISYKAQIPMGPGTTSEETLVAELQEQDGAYVVVTEDEYGNRAIEFVAVDSETRVVEKRTGYPSNHEIALIDPEDSDQTPRVMDVVRTDPDPGTDGTVSVPAGRTETVVRLLVPEDGVRYVSED